MTIGEEHACSFSLIPHPAIERTVMLMTDSLYLLLLKPQVFYLIGVNIYRGSHPTNTTNTPH